MLQVKKLNTKTFKYEMIEEVQSLSVFVDGKRFTLSEQDGMLRILAISDNGQDMINIFPKSSNVIYLDVI